MIILALALNVNGDIAKYRSSERQSREPHREHPVSFVQHDLQRSRVGIYQSTSMSAFMLGCVTKHSLVDVLYELEGSSGAVDLLDGSGAKLVHQPTEHLSIAAGQRRGASLITSPPAHCQQGQRLLSHP